jgi:hypothetical protein
MAKKAKNAPPWTRKKLFKYRSAQRKAQEVERTAAKREQERRDRSGAYVDRALRGTSA